MREEELLTWLNDFWGWTTTGYKLAGMSDPLPEGSKQAYEQIRDLIEVDVHEIIQAVLDHIECKHTPSHEEDGVHVTDEYDVDDKCHEAVRKVLGVEK